MSVTMILSLNEAAAIEELRLLKARGHGTLTVEVRDGLEAMFIPAPKVRPPLSEAKRY
ncbi:MAG: hypothetical protein V4510_10130 [bacterium]